MKSRLSVLAVASVVAAANLVPVAVAPGVAAPAAQIGVPAGVVSARVVRVIDGDTIVTTRGTVRLIGIDTPERGECGFGPATSRAMQLAPPGAAVRLTTSPGNTVDRYGRILRYVSVKGVDFGGAQIQAGYAKARYDSRDGYRWHPRQASYIRWDRQAKDVSCSYRPGASTGGSVYFVNCTAARAAGAAPVRVGAPGYGRHLDRDGDGVGCE